MSTAKRKGNRAGKDGQSRLRQLLEFDRRVSESQCEGGPASCVIGTDEVGRGCLAGPVIACAVQLPAIAPRSALARELAALDDSKVLQPAVRERLAAVLMRVSRYALAEASPEEIDEINILNASLLAMRRSVLSLRPPGSAILLVDGNKKVDLPGMRQMTVVGGDARSASIAAASVIAKVYRDDLMTGLARRHPHYLWESNKGYRSRAHYQALELFGPTSWHRRSFNLGLGGRQLSLFGEEPEVENAGSVCVPSEELLPERDLEGAGLSYEDVED